MTLLSTLKTSLPQPIKAPLKRALLNVLDFSDAAERKREMIPPRTLIFVGDGDYKAIGLEFRRLFTEYGGLKPAHRVLDVGCGTGRMAAPLTAYLSAEGQYEGIDIVKRGIDWCEENITPRFPNFHFRHVDIKNEAYNPDGVYHASTYRFPFESGSFDFVFLTSVFTHMFPADMENYLGEIARVLKTGGSCLITFFLLNDDSAQLIRQNKSTQNFVHELAGCYTTSVDNPEEAIAFPEQYIHQLFLKLDLSIVEPVHFGSWCGTSSFLSYQDVIVAKKIG